MKLIVTGGAGFIGSHLCDALLEKEHTVTAIDNLSMGKIENLSIAKKNISFAFKKIDVLNLDELMKASSGADVIFHFAAFKIPRYGNSLETLKINSLGTINVLEVARRNKCKVVIASTSDVYGKNISIPFSENSDLVLGSSKIKRWSYGASKILNEHFAFAYADEYGIPVTILRIFGSYGPRNHKNWWGGPQAVFIEAALNDRELEIHGDGSQTRSFCYIDDLIEGIYLTATSDKTNNEIINLGNTDEIKIIDLADKIHNLIKPAVPIKLKFVPYQSFTGKKYEDVERRVPDISKAINMIGFEPKTGLTEGLKKTIEWHTKNH